MKSTGTQPSVRWQQRQNVHGAMFRRRLQLPAPRGRVARQDPGGGNAGDTGGSALSGPASQAGPPEATVPGSSAATPRAAPSRVPPLACVLPLEPRPPRPGLAGGAGSRGGTSGRGRGEPAPAARLWAGFLPWPLRGPALLGRRALIGHQARSSHFERLLLA